MGNSWSWAREEQIPVLTSGASVGLSVQPGQPSAAPLGSWLTRTEDVIGGGSISFEAKPIPAPYPAPPQGAFWSRPEAPESGCRPAAPWALTARRVGGSPTNTCCPPPDVSALIWVTWNSSYPSLCLCVSLQKTFETSSEVYMGPFQRTDRKPQQAASGGGGRTSFKLAEHPGSLRAVMLEAFKLST